MRRATLLSLTVLSATIMLSFCAVARAVTIPGVSVQSVSSELNQAFTRDADRLIDGSGLNINGPGSHSTVPDGTMWLNVGTGNCCGGTSYVNSPAAGQDNMPSVRLDLGSVYDIDSLRVWNYNEFLIGRGAKDITVSLSQDNVTFTPAGAFVLNQAPGVNNVDFSQTLAVAGQARYVKIDIQSNYNGAMFPGPLNGVDQNFVGLSEVQVSGTAFTHRLTGVTIADVSTEIGGIFDRKATYLVNGNGLNPLNESHSVGSEGVFWLTNGGTSDQDPYVVFDLGKLTSLGGVQIWNYNEAGAFTGRGVQDMEILAGDSPTGPFYSLGIFHLTRAPGTSIADFSEFFAIDPTTRYIKFDILSNYNGAVFPNGPFGVDNNYVGLSEVRFFDRPVPEPTTALLASLAGLALLRRRSRTAPMVRIPSAV